MRLLNISGTTSLAITLSLLSSTNAITFDCGKIVADKVAFHLSKLGGLHRVSWVRDGSLGVLNTTFNIDICGPLKLDDDKAKRECKEGTRICGIEKQTFEDTGDTEVTDYLPIVRTYTHDGVTMEPKWTRLKSSDSNADSQKEGLRVRLAGGKVKGKDGKTRDQQAIVEFLCEREGDKVRRQLQGRDDDGGDEKKGKPEWEAAKKAEDGVGGTIQFLSYEEDTLRLEWRTKYGCEDAKDDKDDKPKDGDGDGDGEDGGNSSSGGWGFFSWFFFLAFIGILLYFGFSAWINYTRYGAQGWDLIPHSDTIRDIPYILGDWWRKIVGTIGGGGARGGYSAV